ncbi:MAG TPA: hypothetical protein VFA43_03725 [Gemmatimonadaceae bacterium]|nr:hypothetical protein [Gemmatimonadaceae bacterium]
MTQPLSSIHQAAHHFGAYAAARYPAKSWDEIEADLRRGRRSSILKLAGMRSRSSFTMPGLMSEMTDGS